MKIIIPLLTLAVLVAPGAQALAQSAPERSAADITRDLNAPPTGRAQPVRPEPVRPEPVRPEPVRPEPARPEPARAEPQPQPAPAPEPQPASAPQPAPAPAAPSATTVDPAGLPFRLDLPAGFRVTEGRPGPNFHIYAVRRGETAFVMIYAGPASQFPIYDGERVVRGGRHSVIVPEQGRRLALEHLFRTGGEPAEIHVWVTSLEGADRDLAERIAQTIDPR